MHPFESTKFLLRIRPAMRAILPADIIADLESTISGCSADRCIRMLWRTADLLVAGQDRLQAQEIGALDEILVRLTECMQSPVLMRLSTALADLRVAPEKTLQRLAFHDDPAVAAP